MVAKQLELTLYLHFCCRCISCTHDQ